MAKLSEERVAALARRRVGKPFQPARVRVMKEWIEVDGKPASWLALAREAHRFLGCGNASSPDSTRR